MIEESNTTYEAAQHAARIIRTRFADDVRVAVVLGSGLGAFADELANDERAAVFSYEDIPGFARSTVEGHAGRLVIGHVDNVAVVCLQGRFHYYEGYGLDDVTFPIRVLAALGVKSLVLTNAAGGVNAEFAPGTLMLITDHLNLMGVNPLRGGNDARLGVRFPDMSNLYDEDFRRLAKDEAAAMKLDLASGVYAGLSGPSYETPAEIRMLRTLGADAVGMSTVPEAIVARHSGMRVLGISCITNAAAGVSDQPINHEEVIETGARVRGQFTELLRRVLGKLIY
ncbi:MAG: purine-nucleoside phosphorylase [Pyrinomonadaceae bacterium MAG19_C2-C3]|nr:purine-nucleoside phosphorylase [Pyrinomonadaceae bacterium MAG19_C2-C3]